MRNPVFRITSIMIAVALAVNGYSYVLASGNTYYVSNTGNDNNPGTSNAPFKTFSKAASILQAGDTLHVLMGTYNEPLNLLNSGTTNAPITVIGNGVVLDMQGVSDNGINIKGDYVQVSGFEVKGAIDFGIVVSSRYVTVNNNIIHDNSTKNGVGTCDTSSSWGSGLKVKFGGENTILRNNTIYDNCGEGIAITRGVTALVELNSVWDNYSVNIYIDNSPFVTVKNNTLFCTGTHLRDGKRPTGIALGEEFYFGWGTQLHDVLVSNNTITDCRTGIAAYASDVGGTLTNVSILNNYIPNGVTRSISLQNLSNQNVLVADNVIFNPVYVYQSVGITLENNNTDTSTPPGTDGGTIYIGSNSQTSFNDSSDIQILSYQDVLDGPVIVIGNDNRPMVTSQRVTSGDSYNELTGMALNQLTNEYWFPYYDHGFPDITGTNMRMWILIGNPNSSLTAEVEVYIGGILKGSYSIPPGGRVTPRWIGLQDGPVQVISSNGVDIFASERVFTSNTNAFNESLGYPANQFTTEFWFPWYDNVSMNTSILVGNTSTSQTAFVDIYIGDDKKGHYEIPPISTFSKQYPGIINGPVRVLSTNGVNIVTSENTISGPENSFSDTMGYPFDQFTTEYWFPYYDHGYPSIPGSNMRMWLLIGNPSSEDTANVEVYIDGILRGTYQVAPGSRVTPRWIGLQGGPVRVVSDVPVFTSERVFTIPNNVFNEMLGFPSNQMVTEYWFPWYDSVNMDNDLLVIRP